MYIDSIRLTFQDMFSLVVPFAIKSIQISILIEGGTRKLKECV